MGTVVALPGPPGELSGPCAAPAALRFVGLAGLQ